MASDFSFYVVSRVDFQEVENALSQTRKEIAARYDFKNSRVEIVRDKESITITTDDEFRMRAAIDILTSKFIKRGVPIKNLEYGKQESALGGAVRQPVTIRSGIPSDRSKEIVKAIKDMKFKKVQASIQADEIRVSSKDKDALQDVIKELKEKEFGLELQFTNYR